MKTVNIMLIVNVVLTYNCFSQFSYDDEFNNGSVVKNYRPRQPHTIVYDKERLSNKVCDLKIEHSPSSTVNADDGESTTKKKLPIIKSTSRYNENPYSSLLGTPLQPDVYNPFLVVKVIHQHKTIIKENKSLNIKVTIKI